MTEPHPSLADADVVHLSFTPPFAPGSYNSLVGALLAHRSGLSQMAISYWPVGVADADRDARVVVVGPSGGSTVASAAQRLPERLRRAAFAGMGSTDRIRYATEVAALLADRPPPVVVVWDDYKLAPFLRRNADLTSTLVLSQHGRSYHLGLDVARDLYRLDTLDAVITLTRASYEADRGQLYAYEPLVLVRPNGVDTSRFVPAAAAARDEARSAWGLPPDAPVALCLARLAPSKGAHLLLHSWPRVLAQVPDALLWLVGSGGDRYEERLRRTAERLGIADRVRFQGAVPREVVPRCHAAADLYVFPSVQDEGHPLSLLEAMASGMACVAADSPVVRELHGEAVRLVADPNVEDAFVAPVADLLVDDGARGRLGRLAREQVEAGFGLDDYLDEVTGFLARLVRSWGRT